MSGREHIGLMAGLLSTNLYAIFMKFTMGVTPGISFNIPVPAQVVSDYVAEAERLGYKGIAWLCDSQLIWRDVYVSLALAGAKTSSILLGTGVTNPTTRDASVTASAIATLDEATGGRAILGIGCGDSSVNTLGKSPSSINSLRTCIEQIRILLSGGIVRQGKHEMKLIWVKRQVPIYIASTGPRSLELAGEIGDGALINVGADAGLINWAKAHMQNGANRGQRSINELDIWARITCSISDDPEKARNAVKGAAATKANGLARYAQDEYFRSHLSRDLLRDIDLLKEGYNYFEHEKLGARHAELVTDRIIDALVIAGTPEYCIKRIKSISHETNVTRLSFATYGFPDIPGFLKKFAREVIPAIAE